jgi:nicotinate-nucleotide pyrophosphorylase
MKNNIVDYLTKEIKSSKNNLNDTFNIGGTFVSKTSGIISGVEICIQILEKINRENKIYHIKDSKDLVNRGDSIVSIRSNSNDIIRIKTLGENLLSSLSSVSTTMSKYLQEIKDLECDIYVFQNITSNIGELYDAAIEDGGGKVLYANRCYLPYLIWSNGEVGKYFENIQFDDEIYVEVHNISEFQQALTYPCTHIVCVDFDLESIEIATSNKNNKKVGIRKNLTFANIHSYAKNNIDFVIIDNFYRNLKKYEVEFKYFEN